MCVCVCVCVCVCKECRGWWLKERSRGRRVWVIKQWQLPGQSVLSRLCRGTSGSRDRALSRVLKAAGLGCNPEAPFPF